MDRRKFLKTSALGGSAAAATSLAAPAYAQGKRTLTMVTTWGRGAAGVFDAAAKAGELITQMSDGDLTIDVKAGGELVGPFEVFDAVTAGQADMYHAADYYFLNQSPALAFFTAVPFGMTATEMHNWWYQGNGMKLHHEVGEIFGLKSFLCGNTGSQIGGWFRKEINSPEDFQGLKFRMPGIGGQVLGKLGASVQNIPGAETYQALASGAIDGTEWIGPWADEKAGFFEITKIYYTVAFHEPGAGLSLGVNKEVFDSLTPAQQAMIETAAGYTNVWNLSQYLNNNGAALDRLKASGVQVYDFPDTVWDAFGAATKEVYEEMRQDELFAKIYDDYFASMRASAGWLEQSENAYTAQRNRVMG
ncbi:ABC transporter substrate-binding protein [Ruegeria sp. ANG-S4]|uniref:TRAP transporter substrate-binding protein n=1 Tax=Ruegeria sp. ANG-S4 TaxID=1577904 RepID=UPI00057EF614|nr:twin-arginine translocation signal domain-containing protein [Ruegeria sp. ANG-S4]KIC44100.1 ABC transporter substrate-binding protein [Ruegeria sp. ANG-S4]